MSIFDEAQQLEHLTVIGKSLIKYAMSLEPGIVFERQNDWWLANYERNFVGFQFHWTNSVSITLSLYGTPEEQFQQDILPVKKGKFNYSRCRLTDENQLMPATVSIWRAHQLFYELRSNETGTLLLLDEADVDRDNWLRPRPGLNDTKGNDNITVTETTAWYDEVRAFIKKNKIIDSSILT